MYSVQLKDRKEVASGTMAFYFEKPEGFDFKAGQFMELTLIDPPETDAEGNTRAFTIASAPYEPDLMIATRMRDTAFKRVLKTLPPGSTVNMEGPFGVLTLHADVARRSSRAASGLPRSGAWRSRRRSRASRTACSSYIRTAGRKTPPFSTSSKR